MFDHNDPVWCLETSDIYFRFHTETLHATAMKKSIGGSSKVLGVSGYTENKPPLKASSCFAFTLFLISHSLYWLIFQSLHSFLSPPLRSLQLFAHKSWWLLWLAKEPHLLLSPTNPRSLMRWRYCLGFIGHLYNA